MSNRLCIYHANCTDGFGSAYSVNLFYNGDVEFFKGHHGRTPPDVTGKNVIIVDFSYKRDVIIEMAKTADSILIIDHHISAEKDLKDLNIDNVKVVFDMGHSGAVLTWNHYFSDEPPLLIRYIEDRDLWKFKMLDTNDIIAALIMYEFDFNLWDALMTPHSVAGLAKEGSLLNRKKDKDILQLIKSCLYYTNFNDYKDIPIINVPHFYASDMGHAISKGKPFAIMYHNTERGRSFSLRSQKDGGIDVSEIAVSYGGGGHKNAAGFVVDRNHELYLI